MAHQQASRHLSRFPLTTPPTLTYRFYRHLPFPPIVSVFTDNSILFTHASHFPARFTRAFIELSHRRAFYPRIHPLFTSTRVLPAHSPVFTHSYHLFTHSSLNMHRFTHCTTSLRHRSLVGQHSPASVVALARLRAKSAMDHQRSGERRGISIDMDAPLDAQSHVARLRVHLPALG